MGRRLRRLTVGTTACLAVALGISIGGPAATPDATAQDAESAAWGQARQPDQLDLELIEASPVQVGDALTVRFRIHNPTDQAVEDLQVTTRRGDAVATTAEARTQLAQGSFPYFGASANPGTLGPGETREVSLTIPTGLEGEGSLAMTEAGIYPLLYTLTGTRDGEPVSLSEDRTLLDLAPKPGEESPSDVAEDPAAEDADDFEPHDLSVIYPITDTVDIVPGDTGGQSLILDSDHLAQSLSPGGRLDRLVDSYLSHDLQGAACAALDPALLSVVERMEDGYTVHDSRPSVAHQTKRLRDSWFNDDADYRGESGQGSRAASQWLAKIKQLDCVMAMPWADADPLAVRSVDNAWLDHEAFAHGAEIIERLAGHPLASNALVGSKGYVTEDLGRPAVVADNSIWEGQALSFDASLGSLLAQTGTRPQTTAYSNPELRYDYRVDSVLARDLSAAAALRLGAQEDDTLAVLPATLEPATADQVLAAGEAVLGDHTAQPKPVAALPLETSEAAEQGLPAGSPYVDPAAFDATQTGRIKQQAKYADELTKIMVNDPHIALTRYGFTQPLRHDLLTALSATRRTSLPTTQESEEASIRRLDANSNTLQELRSSVTLLPPGNVYTRVSESSPLLIVAENGLPLPVEATLEYQGPDNARLNTPERVRIPATGSITVNMTADLPEQTDRIRMELWLATPESDMISQPISIAVQTRAGILSVYGIGIAAALAVGLALLFKVGRKKKSET
ncbi:hypothetical protein [Corynebacterium confusum]|uniref:hypothetical protein n=1 Tax=Corynebacterium confusum TaxID=71254 RepID=UPI0025B30262|nr:hypothetical protein [Corynebacterium confusum]WJY90764.1 hypothetical protein CCONF_11370 [Corynebacterium confusum]